MSISPVDSTTNPWYVTGQRPPLSPPPLTNTSALLDVSPQEIEDAEKSGKSLADLAAEKGVPTDDVIASVTQDLQAAVPQGGPAPSVDQVTQLATDMVDGKRSAPPAHRGDSADDDQVDNDRSLRNLTNVAQSMGTDVNSLLAQLSSGDGSSDDIVSMLTKTNSSNYGTSLSDLITGGLSVDTYA